MESITSRGASGNAYSEAQESTESIIDIFNRKLEKRKSDSLETGNSQGDTDMVLMQWQSPLPILLARLKGNVHGKGDNTMKAADSFHKVPSSASEVNGNIKLSLRTVQDDMRVNRGRAELSVALSSTAIQTPAQCNVIEIPDTFSKKGVQSSVISKSGMLDPVMANLSVAKSQGKDLFLSTAPKSSHEHSSLKMASTAQVEVPHIIQKLEGDLVESNGQHDATNVINSQSGIQLATKLMAFSTQSASSTADRTPVDMKSITIAESSNAEPGTLTYRFQRWGGEHSVNIQSQPGGAITLQPSDGMVEQKLSEQWSSGNPQRWQLAQDGSGKQQQQQQQQNEEEDV